MIHSISTLPAANQETAGVAEDFTTNQEIPLEQRTDVTVDELEKLSISAELYDGKVVFKINTLRSVLLSADGTGFSRGDPFV